MFATLLPLILLIGAQDVDALMDACERGDAEAVASALARGVPVDARDDEGLTALMVASAEGNLEVVRLLLEAGADVNAATDEGLNALSYARDAEVRTLLESNGAEKAWDTEPKLLHKPPDPKYPERARKNMISGQVVLRIKVKTDGSTEVMEVIESLPYCDDTAKKNAEQWRWTPAEKNGKPVVALGVIVVTFDIFSQRKR